MTSTAPSKTRVCIYCEHEKPETEFSLEHIFPDRLGGKLCSNLFKTHDVCGRCNNLMGLFVDAPFIKSWFHKNDEAMAARQYLDLTSPESVEPLVYMGRLKDVQLESDEVCELWLGPCGAINYHFHAADEAAFAAYAGGNPIARKSDPGRAYLFLTSEKPEWYALAIRSFVAAFPRADRYAGNFGIQDNPAAQIVRSPDTTSAKDLSILAPLRGQYHNCEFTTAVGFETRWLAKLARGMGANLFGTDFLGTAYAGHLKSALWERDANKRATIPVRGTGYFGDQEDPTDKLVGWPGAYTIRLHALSDKFALSIHLPSQKSMHVVIADEPSLWSGPKFSAYEHGQVFLVVPSLGRFVGPISLPNYLAHRIKQQVLPELKELEDKQIDPDTLPACK